jgi:hypothetical protein
VGAVRCVALIRRTPCLGPWFVRPSAAPNAGIDRAFGARRDQAGLRQRRLPGVTPIVFAVWRTVVRLPAAVDALARPRPIGGAIR